MVISSARRPAVFDLIVMIGSLGAFESAAAVLSTLPKDFPVPVVFLQHGRPRAGTEAVTELLQRRTRLPVATATPGHPVTGPGITVIPRGSTARFDQDYRVTLHPAAAGGGGDAILESAAEAAGPRLIAVVLTGMLADGAQGVRSVKRRGGRVLIEDPNTARAAGMPSNAIATGCVDFSLPNTRLGSALLALACAPGGAELFRVPIPAWATFSG